MECPPPLTPRTGAELTTPSSLRVGRGKSCQFAERPLPLVTERCLMGPGDVSQLEGHPLWREEQLVMIASYRWGEGPAAD